MAERRLQVAVSRRTSSISGRASTRLSTEVVDAVPTAAGWELSTVDAVSGATDSVPVDYLVVANGIFSYPLVPSFVGADEHAAAGGSIRHTSEIHDLDDVRGKHVVVVGYGKSGATSPRRSARSLRAPLWSPVS